MRVYQKQSGLRYIDRQVFASKEGFELNAERLHAVANAIKQELDSSRLVENFQELTNALQNLVNQPNQPQWQQIVSNKRVEIQTALEKAPPNQFNPAWWQIVNEIGGRGLLGNQLEQRIREIFERNQITLPIANQEIVQINQALANFKNGIDQLVGGL